jgi:thymidylate synthase
MISVVAQSPGEAWEKSIEEFFCADSKYYYASAFGPCVEVLDMSIEVENPMSEAKLSEKYDFNNNVQSTLARLISKKTKGIETLHDRIFRWGRGRAKKYNQFESAIKTLKQDRFSRRAVVTLWDPAKDIQSGPFDLCPVAFTLMIREGALHCSLFIRSSDAWLATPIDMLSFIEIQKMAADELKVNVGKYVHHAVSYHIYNYDIPRAKDVFGV